MTRHTWNEHHHKLTTITLYSYKNIFVLLVMRTIRIYSLSNFSVNSSVNYIVVMYINYIKGLFLYPAADPIQVGERALCSLQFLWGSAWWRLYLHNTISTQEEGAWRIMYQLKCCCPELTWVTIPQISLDKATHMIHLKLRGPRSLTLSCVWKERRTGNISEHG